MIYAILSFLGTLLALVGGVWYLAKKSGTDAGAITGLKSENQILQDKVKTLDDRIVDTEYRRRAEERLRNANIAKVPTAADIAGRMLSRDRSRDDDGTN